MNRRDFIKQLAIFGSSLGAAQQLLTSGILRVEAFAEKREYYRIVLLGDPHLPVRTRNWQDWGKQQKILAAKDKVIDDINNWDDVKQIVVLGDITARFGTEEEYFYAKQYIAGFNKPVSVITGNHDYIYTDTPHPNGKFAIADAASRELKLNRFKETFGLETLFYSQTVGRYLLIFLSVDALEATNITQISEQQLQWFGRKLAENPGAPTIVFFHAPLEGTLHSYNKHVNTPNFIVQPWKGIEEIIANNPQVLLWVSGHTHTPATNVSYASDVNKWGGHVTNIHNADMERETIWTNSLYLYPDRVLIKTYNHKDALWEEKLERTIYL